MPKKQEVCNCSSWSSDEYHSDTTNNSKNSRVVRNRNGPYDALNTDRSLYHSPRRRADTKNYYPKGLSDSENSSTQRQLKSPATNHKRSHSNNSHRTVDSGKESAANTTSLSSSCCTEPFYLHEPHMTSNDRVKQLFEKEKRNTGIVSRRKEEYVRHSNNNKHLGKYDLMSLVGMLNCVLGLSFSYSGSAPNL